MKHYWVEHYQYGMDDRLDDQTPCKSLNMARRWLSGEYRPDSRAVSRIIEVGEDGKGKEIARRNWNEKRTRWHKQAALG